MPKANATSRPPALDINKIIPYTEKNEWQKILKMLSKTASEEEKSVCLKQQKQNQKPISELLSFNSNTESSKKRYADNWKNYGLP